MNNSKHKAFTLVELIVVVTILAILATIGFVSYSSYLTGVRDTNRLAQLVSIHDGLELYRTKKDLPLPDESVDVIIGSDSIAYQGFAGSNTLETIDFTKGGLDPRDKSYFSYYLTADRKYFQLMAFLEEEANVTTQVSPSPLRRGLGLGVANAVDYTDRIPTIYGKKLGILTDNQNTPIQDFGTDLDLNSVTETYKAYLSNDEVLEGSGGALISLYSVNNKNLAINDLSLIGYWDMETTIDIGGVKMLKDFSSYGNHGFCKDGTNVLDCFSSSNGPQKVEGRGQHGKAVRFDGLDNVDGDVDHIEVPDSASLSPGAITIIVLGKTKDKTNINTPTYVRKDHDYFLDNVSGLRFGRNQLFGEITSPNDNFGEYNTFVGSYGPGVFVLYANGDLVNTGSYTVPINDNSGTLKIGARNDIHANNLSGDIDEVRIYNRAMTDSEIKVISNILD